MLMTPPTQLHLADVIIENEAAGNIASNMVPLC
jgi:hypothetical protein